jgi:ABC-type transport system substrate-binding protein
MPDGRGQRIKSRSGSWGHLEFGDQFPYAPEKAKALLTEAGYDAKHPRRYTLMIPVRNRYSSPSPPS